MQGLNDSDFKLLVQNYPRAVMLSTTEPRIVYVNQSFEAVTGYKAEEVIGERPSILSSGLHSTDFYQAMWQSLIRDRRWEGLIWNRRKNGELYPQWLSLFSVVRGSETLYAAVFMDLGDLPAGDGRLASLAYYDALTELPNRSLLNELLKARMAKPVAEHRRFAVLIIDLDFFKTVNDLHGHELGDRVLRHAAWCIQSVVREDDAVARLSGDEFAAIVELDGPDALDDICLRVIRAIQAPVIIDQRELFLSASVGAAQFPEHGREVSELLQNADRAVYTAKLDGRGGYRIYSASDGNQARRIQRLSEALIASLKTAPDEFHVHYQPQYNLQTGEVVALEALIRWCHPDFGPVSPAEFVPIAEHRGYIHELTERLVRCLLRDLPERPEPELKTGLGLAINLSARHMSDVRLEAVLAPLFERLRRLGWRPELEITETSMMNLSTLSLRRLREFQQRGGSIAIDDFGTGYSSLAYLHTLPVQVLKIDRQFVRHLGDDGHDDRIVSAILGIAEALGLEVVAEGVETEPQYRRLQALGCHRGQGYLMARPQTWASVERLLIDEHQINVG